MEMESELAVMRREWAEIRYTFMRTVDVAGQVLVGVPCSRVVLLHANYTFAKAETQQVRSLSPDLFHVAGLAGVGAAGSGMW